MTDDRTCSQSDPAEAATEHLDVKQIVCKCQPSAETPQREVKGDDNIPSLVESMQLLNSSPLLT